MHQTRLSGAGLKPASGEPSGLRRARYGSEMPDSERKLPPIRILPSACTAQDNTLSFGPPPASNVSSRVPLPPSAHIVVGLKIKTKLTRLKNPTAEPTEPGAANSRNRRAVRR